MNLDTAYIADVENDGLLDDLTKLHVLSVAYKNEKGKYSIKSTDKKEDIFTLFENPDNIIVGHNFYNYDIKALKILYPEIQIRAFIIDSLYLSYYLYSELDAHGLEAWGEIFGVPKPEIKPEEWKTLSYEKAKHRCEEDVKINTKLWVKALKYLRAIYKKEEDVIRVIRYLNFKAECIAIQDENPILLNIKRCKKNSKILEGIIEEKSVELQKIMPKKGIFAKRTKPKTMYKKDGSLSSYGEKWMELLKENDLPEDYDGEIKVRISEEEANPGSPQQVKDFLFSLGWKPRIFKPGANGKVPQISNDDKELCESIQDLIEDYPELESLEGLSVAKHRLGILKAFLEKSNDKGYAVAWAHGLTRTLRFKHAKPFVNLPKPDAKYGEYIRSAMIAPKGYVCIGADLSSIEDKCKQISIYHLDPSYVESMNTPGWDAHLALGLKAGMFTEDEVQFYKWFETLEVDKENPKLKETVLTTTKCPKSFKNLSDFDKITAFAKLKKKRAKAKTTNYAATYGAGAPKIAESGGMSKKEAKSLHRTYWDMNWAVKRFARERKVKTVKGHNWLKLSKKVGGIKEVTTTDWIWNEYSDMWLYLKNDKDRFSACNQNFGVKVFDIWLYILIKEGGIKPIYQSHDETLWYCLDDKEEIQRNKDLLDMSVKKLNNIFKPPIPIEISYKIGKDYSKVH